MLTHQGPGRELRASRGKGPASEVLARCEGPLKVKGGAEVGTVLCGGEYEKKRKKINKHLNLKPTAFIPTTMLLFSSRRHAPQPFCVRAATSMCTVYFYQPCSRGPDVAPVPHQSCQAAPKHRWPLLYPPLPPHTDTHTDTHTFTHTYTFEPHT